MKKPHPARRHHRLVVDGHEVGVDGLRRSRRGDLDPRPLVLEREQLVVHVRGDIDREHDERRELRWPT